MTEQEKENVAGGVFFLSCCFAIGVGWNWGAGWGIIAFPLSFVAIASLCNWEKK
jgi:hypothetical protein